MLAATDSFLKTHNEWVDAPDTSLLTDEYEDALEDLFKEFAGGDVPARCRDLVAAVATLAEEWEKFQGYVTQLRPRPREGFWAAVEAVGRARDGVTEPERRPIESVAQLIKQNVPLNQIAMYIYGWQPREGANYVGPFLQNGVPRHDLIYQEAEKPHSVLPEGWVHPQEAARLKDEAERHQRCQSRLRDKIRTAPEAPESIEELLRQNVPAKQIADMKQVDIQEVHDTATKLGLKAADVPNLNATRGHLDPPLNPHTARELDDRRVEAERREAAVLDELPVEGSDAEIRSYLEADFSVADVIQQTGADPARVEAVQAAMAAAVETKPAKKARRG